MNNLAELILDRAARRPDARFGVAEEPLRLGEAVELARRAAGALAQSGLGAGKRVALIGRTSNSYLLAWLALQLAGLEAGLVNPDLPDDLIRSMLVHLQPEGVVWVGRPPDPDVAPGSVHLDADGLVAGRLLLAGSKLDITEPDPILGGLARSAGDIAGYMHTSGTTGMPKFCAQTQSYYLRLGRFVADAMAISAADTVLAPLPMFHINPLGYGVVGGLSGGADVLGMARFSASGFWPLVKERKVTVAFLHAPPVEILKKATAPADAAGHGLRCVFYADAGFLEQFRVPLGYSCYGSTESGGITHFWTWRLGDRCPHPEGMARYAGIPRHDIEWDLAPDGELLIRGREEHVISSGYQTAEGLSPLASDDGWFHTGDTGRRDEQGHLIFVERMAESIRVKGEYVPIAYVEELFGRIEGLNEVALWRRTSNLVDHEVILYVVANGPLPREPLVRQAAMLPAFMRPVEVVRIPHIPRTSGVGKVSRRSLGTMERVEVLEL